MQKFIVRQTSLPEHSIQFVRFLREKGFSIGVFEESDLLNALSQRMSQSFDEHKSLHRSILVKNRKQFLQFNTLYNEYWDDLSKAEDAKKQDYQEPKKSIPKKNTNELHALKQWLYAGRIEEEKELSSYSSFEAITTQDFSSFSEKDHKELHEIIRLIAQRMSNSASRRYMRSRKKKELDLKKTIKHALRHSLEIKEFVYKKPKMRKTQLVLICDVSKSMELYSKFMIDFIYGFQQAVYKLNTFIFSTELVSITRILKDENYEKLLENLSEQVKHWSGGTRIGESLLQFKIAYGVKLIDKNAIVLIVSDGWDTGEMESLESSMRYLQRRSNRVIWINPLAGNPAHNLESLRNIARHLSLAKYKPKF